jgi:hypothetical protein
MSNFYTTHEPHWEATEHNWRAVASPCNDGAHWVAYIEFASTPHFRIWADHMFDTIEDAQQWCSGEITRQTRQNTNGLEISTDDSRWVWGNLESMYNNVFMAS